MNKNYFPLSENFRAAAGFTLTEVLVAIALIVAIVGIAVVSLTGISESARVDAAVAFVKFSLEAPLLKYQMDTGAFPNSTEGILALVAAPEGANGWRGPYLKIKGVPEDPWHMPYQYAYPGHHNGPQGYDLWSSGPDKVSGTVDDIVNW